MDLMGAKIKGCIPSGGSRKKSVSMPLLASRIYPHSLAYGHISPTKSSVVAFPSLTLTSLPTFYKNLCNYIRTTWIISPSQDP